MVTSARPVRQVFQGLLCKKLILCEKFQNVLSAKKVITNYEILARDLNSVLSILRNHLF